MQRSLLNWAIALSLSSSAAFASQGPGVAAGGASQWLQNSAKLLVGLLAIVMVFGVLRFAARYLFKGFAHRS